MKQSIVLITLFILCGCSNYKYDPSQPTEFFRIDSAKSKNGEYHIFVVNNPPKDTLLLQKYIENYNLRTIPLEKLEIYNGYMRSFYRESEFLTRDYVFDARDPNPRSPYTYQDLVNFQEDLLMTIEYSKWYDGKYRYSYYFNWNFDGKQTAIIHSLDSLYHAKRIETADVDTTMVREGRR